MAAAIEVNAPFLGVDSDSEEEDEEIVPTTAVSRARSSAPPLPKAIITSRGADIPTPTSVKRRQSLGGLALSTAFTEAQLLSASDRFRDAWSKVQAHEWDVRSWAALLSEAQTQRSGRAIALRDVYRLATRQFATKVSLWKDWL